METINLRGLPEPVARAIAETVENLKQQFKKRRPGRPASLPVWSLGATGKLTREEIYDHLDRGT